MPADMCVMHVCMFVNLQVVIDAAVVFKQMLAGDECSFLCTAASHRIAFSLLSTAHIEDTVELREGTEEALSRPISEPVSSHHLDRVLECVYLHCAGLPYLVCTPWTNKSLHTVPTEH